MVEFGIVTYIVVGIALLGGILLPRVMRDQPVSMPMVYVAAGFFLFALPVTPFEADPTQQGPLVERTTELVVIISLMGAGLKIDRPFSLHRWTSTWRLLGITMPLTVVLAALLGWQLLGLQLATAILLGAVVAPTDPVLASDVQAGEPLEGIEEDVDRDEQAETTRFALTSEAGLNDGLAFPVTNLAIAAAAAAGTAPALVWVGEWFLVDVLYKIVVGVIAGYLLGRLLATLIFRTLGPGGVKRAIAGAEILAATLITYGVTELVGGYGFIAVFVCSLEMRHFEWEHEYHRTLHEFAEIVEHLLMGGVLLLFGGAIAGGLLTPLGLTEILLGFLLILVVRPVCGIVGLLGFDATWAERSVIASFGIRGIGSFFYLSHALNEAGFQEIELIVAREILWAIVGFFVLTSIVFHGILAKPVMRMLERRRGRITAAEVAPDE